MDKLLESLESYFPEGDLEDFDIFDQRKWPKQNSEIAFYGQGAIQRLSSKLYPQLRASELALQWRNVITLISEDAEFCKYSKSRPTVFWQHYLKSTRILWPQQLSRFLQTVLVLAVGSADAERGFSVINDIKKQQTPAVICKP